MLIDYIKMIFQVTIFIINLVVTVLEISNVISQTDTNNLLQLLFFLMSFDSIIVSF